MTNFHYFAVVEIFEQGAPGTTLFAEVLLPVPIPKLFTYRVPVTMNGHIATGQRVIVQFGDRKVLTGLVMNLHEEPPKDYEAKYILELLDDLPSVNDLQLRFYRWIADYYLCTQGEVFNAALPAGLKLSSESIVQLHPSFNLEESEYAFSEKELMLLKQLEHQTMSYSEISKFLGVKRLYNILKSLTGKGAILLFEEVKEKYRPKKEKRVRLCEPYTSAEALETLFETLASRPKQEAVLLKYLQEVPVLQDPAANNTGVAKNKLLSEDSTASPLNTLIRNKVIEEFEVVVPRFGAEVPSTDHPVLLSEDQQQALSAIYQSFETNTVTLLHGITGSGKTEIYINLIRKALESGTQVLYLLPEIALTTQMVQRLKKIFGSSMGVYHSRFSDNERVEVWNGVRNGDTKFVLGVRSSIFLPFDNLGLIIVDEEHDPSYKQQEPAPRYHARDAVMVLAQLHHAKVLLGSATPSVETLHHAQQGKYGFVRLDKRFGEAKLPEIVLVDMSRERKMKTVKGEFSGVLLKAIGETLANQDQAIIFQNRRGYSPIVNCVDCGWIPRCINCSVSLTYHQYKNVMECHYCGYRETLPGRCPVCTSARIHTVGYGTEKLEEELKIHFPEASIQRMDLDTTRSKTGYETIIEQFEKGETDILVGTQMVTKGLDFDRVSLVGVFNADRMIHFPDFRSHERAHQLILQVSGRAGRREKPGKVIIQTHNPDHPVLRLILNNRQDEFYQQEIEDRRRHGFPPFTRLIEITTRHMDKKTCRDASHFLTEKLRSQLQGIRVLGPAEPMIAKLRNQYLMSTLVKIPRGKGDLANIKSIIQQVTASTLQEKNFRQGRIIIDVDPV